MKLTCTSMTLVWSFRNEAHEIEIEFGTPDQDGRHTLRLPVKSTREYAVGLDYDFPAGDVGPNPLDVP